LIALELRINLVVMVSVAVLIQVKRSLRREHFENTHIADKGKVCFHIILQSCPVKKSWNNSTRN